MLRIQLLRTDITEEKFQESYNNLQNMFGDMNNVLIDWVSDCRVESRKKESERIANRNICLNPFLSVSIKADGTVVPCCYDFFSSISLGNINTERLEDIWNGERINELRKSVISFNNEPELCKVCMFKSPVVLVNSFTSKLIKFKHQFGG